ncbi:MAG TPA: hypothetical protein VJ824_16750 [Bacillota bacterium]|nr:hypothetical protein [Bacillota bacterium]
MISFGAVAIDWGNMVFQLLCFLMFLALPIIVAIFFYRKSSKRKNNKIAELEQRIQHLEQNKQKSP